MSGRGPPQDNGDAVELLGRHGVVPANVATAMRKAVGFRNVLVHGYVEVDDSVVTGRLDDVSDLRHFVRAVASWVSGGSDG